MRILSALNIFGTKKATVFVRQPHGLHMRPSAAVAKLSGRTQEPLYFSYNKQGWQNVRNSLLSILLMNIQEGTKLKIKASKKYPKDIFDKIINIISSNDVNICRRYIGNA